MRRLLLDNKMEAPVAFSRKERATRWSLLDDDPGIEAVSMPMLVGIANAIENEAVRRYALLTELMERRGEPATAAAFRAMLEEERKHVVSVDRWAAAVGEPMPPTGQFEWHLPTDLSSSWDDISASALLTPYRAFALAAENEQRAFAFYAYLAAHAENAQIRAEAEKLGAEELRHAALLRRWRRRAFHLERRPTRVPDLEIASIDVLHETLARHEAAIALSHRALARRLKRVGDDESALLLEHLLEAPTWPAAPVAGSGPGDAALEGAGSAAAVEGDPAPAEDDPAHLLMDAQKPLEALSETLESVMRTTEGALFQETASAMANVVGRLARISLQSAHRLQLREH